ncbi:MAG: redoxin domain-containing protein [Bryobacteraceae bacterium]|nr:redoxin domain-containing protein [Bryobacteraceae bacterium]
MLRRSLPVLFALPLLAGALFAGGLKVGDAAPEFDLKAVDGSAVRYSQLSGDVTVIAFIATECPVSNNYNDRMKALYNDYHAKGVKFIFINSNNTEPAAAVKEHAASHGFAFQVYKDPGNVVADQLGAQVTPEVFLVKSGKVAYHGRIDDAQKGEIKDHSLRNALDAVLHGHTPERAELKAFGCTIKRVKAS